MQPDWILVTAKWHDSSSFDGKIIMQKEETSFKMKKRTHHLFPPQRLTLPCVILCFNWNLSNKNSSTFTAPSSLPLSRFTLLPHFTDFQAHAFFHSVKSATACKIIGTCSQAKWSPLAAMSSAATLCLSKADMIPDPWETYQFHLEA